MVVASCSFGLKSGRLLVVVLKKHGESLLELEFVNTFLVGCSVFSAYELSACMNVYML